MKLETELQFQNNLYSIQDDYIIDFNIFQKKFFNLFKVKF